MLAATSVSRYEGADLSETALALAAQNLKILSCPVILTHGGAGRPFRFSRCCFATTRSTPLESTAPSTIWSINGGVFRHGRNRRAVAALGKFMLEAGITILPSETMVRILIENGTAKGAALETGEIIAADIDPRQREIETRP